MVYPVSRIRAILYAAMSNTTIICLFKNLDNFQLFCARNSEKQNKIGSKTLASWLKVFFPLLINTVMIYGQKTSWDAVAMNNKTIVSLLENLRNFQLFCPGKSEKQCKIKLAKTSADELKVRSSFYTSVIYYQKNSWIKWCTEATSK